MVSLIIVLILVGILIIGGIIGFIYLNKEHTEAKSLSLSRIDFSKLKDGVYKGFYEGGMYRWRTNEVEVTVSSGKVTKIKLLMHKENCPSEFTERIYNKVIESQTLQVDTVSGSTLTSKAYLKSVERALLEAAQ